MHLADELNRLAAAHRGGRCLALLFDFDGTLAPLVTHPDLATCAAATQQVLEALALLPRVIVGIITGRTLADLKSKISLPKLIYAGTCGLEIELSDGLIWHPDAVRYAPMVEAAAEVVTAAIRDFPGAWVEHKPFALTVHYRQVRREDTSLFRQCLERTLARFEGVLTAINGSMATEVLPDVGWGKGAALETIVKHDRRNPIPLYAGNDSNDAGALHAVLARGGVAIGVGPDAPPHATHRLPDVETLAANLGQLHGLLTSGGNPSPLKK